MFSSLWIKLAVSGFIIAVVLGGVFYVRGLQSKVANQDKQIVQLENDKTELEETIKENERLQGITVKIDQLASPERNRYIVIRDSNEKKINEDATAGKDKPVGPLLKDFLNDAE